MSIGSRPQVCHSSTASLSIGQRAAVIIHRNPTKRTIRTLAMVVCLAVLALAHFPSSRPGDGTGLDYSRTRSTPHSMEKPLILKELLMVSRVRGEQDYERVRSWRLVRKRDTPGEYSRARRMRGRDTISVVIGILLALAIKEVAALWRVSRIIERLRSRVNRILAAGVIPESWVQDNCANRRLRKPTALVEIRATGCAVQLMINVAPWHAAVTSI
jgi:hypothetical protein